MKQETALYWCLFHSTLNAKLKVITSNWVNFKLVLQEPQKVQMRSEEPSLLIYPCFWAHTDFFDISRKKSKTHVRMDCFIIFWPHQARSSNCWRGGRKGSKRAEIRSFWVRNYLKQLGQAPELIAFLWLHVRSLCWLWLPLTNSVTF